MSKVSPVEILGIGIMSPVGLTSFSTAAAVRAGISRCQESRFLNKYRDPIVLAKLPDKHLPELALELEDEPSLSGRQCRMLRVAGPALRESLKGIPDVEGIPLLLGFPESGPGNPGLSAPDLFNYLALQAGVRFAIKRSSVYSQGRASSLVALHNALKLLATGSDRLIIVGGLDSYFDEGLLRALDAEDRLHAEGVDDGFVPGEGAAFLLLGAHGSARRLAREPRGFIVAASAGAEPGHRYSTEIFRGDGLDATFRALFQEAWPRKAPVQTVYAGFNGENLNAKEWGVAYLRHRKHFAEELRIEHPADCLGDSGAAMGSVMLGLAAIGIERGYRRSPCLVWCSSDRETRGAALVCERSSP
jgi:3-oxoacyl-[acyl-carrier-protein] synthase-1